MSFGIPLILRLLVGSALPTRKEAAPRLELGMEVLQTSALPLGHAAKVSILGAGEKMERETGFEPATSTLATLRSTS